jgi:hypothetical protein
MIAIGDLDVSSEALETVPAMGQRLATAPVRIICRRSVTFRQILLKSIEIAQISDMRNRPYGKA